MSVNTGEIQPISADSWIVPDLNRAKEVQAVPPVAKGEGATTNQVGEHRASAAQDSPAPPQPRNTVTTEEMASEVQSYLNETMNVELNFKIEDTTGKTVVQVLDKSTGEIIRQIPPKNLLEVRDKLEELRGVLFDGQV